MPTREAPGYGKWTKNGSIAGQRPVDWAKFWLVMAAILSPGVLLGLLGLITIPLAGFGLMPGDDRLCLICDWIDRCIYLFQPGPGNG